MNKDVIYIEPENDITDILAKLKQSEQKVVALVPPKKAGTLHSAVNIKLIAKTARDAEKAAVLVTTDPSIIKLAAAAKIPVAKNLQSRPEIPTAAAAAAIATAATAQIIEEDLSDQDEPEKPAEDKSKKSNEKSEKDTNKDDKKDKKGKKDKKNVPAIEKYRKWIIIGAIAVVLIIGFLIWALVFAPAVKIAVSVKTSPEDFSENVTFVTEAKNEDAEKGKFFLEERTTESKATVNFTATGQRDDGQKATGTLKIGAYFRSAATINVPSGSSFSYNGLKYQVSSGTAVGWDGSDESQCDKTKSSYSTGCYISTSVSVAAAEPGTNYNIGAQTSGWVSNVGDVSVDSSSAMAGGTSDLKTIVTQSDVDKAKSGIASTDDNTIKLQLLSELKSDYVIIDDSFSTTVSDAVSSPAVGAEVPAGTTPTLTVTTKSTIKGVSKNSVETFIKAKTTVASDQTVYSIGEPYFERYTETGAKLKSTVYVGPKISEEEILEKAKGRKIGEVKSALSSITGVSDVNITPSFFWVNTVPDSTDKIEVELNFEGNS